MVREFPHLEFPGVPRFSPLDLGHGSLGRGSLGTLGRCRSFFSRFLGEFTQISELVFVPMPLSHSSFPVFFLGKPRHGGRSLAFPARAPAKPKLSVKEDRKRRMKKRHWYEDKFGDLSKFVKIGRASCRERV